MTQMTRNIDAATALAETTKLSRRTARFEAVEDFYVDEAALLDTHRYEDWLALLAPEFSYWVPVRTTTYRKDLPGFSDTVSFFEDTRASIATRVRRLVESKSAWSEEPPSRTRRLVTNLRAGTTPDGEIVAASYLLIVRSRGDDPDFEMLSAERLDRFRVVGSDRLELVHRSVLLDQSVIGAINLALFL